MAFEFGVLVGVFVEVFAGVTCVNMSSTKVGGLFEGVEGGDEVSASEKSVSSGVDGTKESLEMEVDGEEVELRSVLDTPVTEGTSLDQLTYMLNC